MAIKNYTLGEHEIRKHARNLYVNTLTSPFDKCGYCSRQIVWKQLLTSRQLKRLKEPLFATIEHVVPLSQGGGNLLSNLMGACEPCNNERSVRTPKPKNNQTKKMNKNRPRVFTKGLNLSNKHE
jgi:5-methylcytosine-specific restriction endonuclease McrA